MKVVLPKSSFPQSVEDRIQAATQAIIREDRLRRELGTIKRRQEKLKSRQVQIEAELQEIYLGRLFE